MSVPNSPCERRKFRLVSPPSPRNFSVGNSSREHKLGAQITSGTLEVCNPFNRPDFNTRDAEYVTRFLLDPRLFTMIVQHGTDVMWRANVSGMRRYSNSLTLPITEHCTVCCDCELEAYLTHWIMVVPNPFLLSKNVSCTIHKRLLSGLPKYARREFLVCRRCRDWVTWFGTQPFAPTKAELVFYE